MQANAGQAQGRVRTCSALQTTRQAAKMAQAANSRELPSQKAAWSISMPHQVTDCAGLNGEGGHEDEDAV